MDIAALSMAMAQNNIGTQIGFAVFNLAKDSAEQNSEQLVDMMASASMALSVNPSVGANIDMQV